MFLRLRQAKESFYKTVFMNDDSEYAAKLRVEYYRTKFKSMGENVTIGKGVNIVNPEYEIIVWTHGADVCIPFLKGYTPPYYPVVFNYVVSNVTGYVAEQTNDGWHVTFSSTLFSSTDYTFTFEIYSRYGGATLTISSPFYNSVQYTGNLFAI